MSVEQFVISHLPQAPASVLEVGCGAGKLAAHLSTCGYDITAIDPQAPDGAIFRKTSLEDFSAPRPFDAVVANRSLHHLTDLGPSVTKLRNHLRDGGFLILNEFAWDRMDDKTAEWYLSHVDRPAPEDESLLPENFPEAWIAEHDGLCDSASMRETLDDFFRPNIFEWVPYIAEHYLKRPDLIEEERDLIRSGAINPIGFHYVGTRA